MVIIMFGAPGVGKGSQATILSRTLCIPHISTGDIFREHVTKNTELGLIIRNYMSQGAYVPDQITIKILLDRIHHDDCKNGFILDGFPRTLSQAEHLDTIIKEDNIHIDAVINITLDDQEIISRLSDRRICPSCNLVYHLVHNKPDESGKCNQCKQSLIQREDDQETTIIKRLELYHAQTKSLLTFYRNEYRVCDVISQN